MEGQIRERRRWRWFLGSWPEWGAEWRAWRRVPRDVRDDLERMALAGYRYPTIWAREPATDWASAMCSVPIRALWIRNVLWPLAGIVLAAAIIALARHALDPLVFAALAVAVELATSTYRILRLRRRAAAILAANKEPRK